MSMPSVDSDLGFLISHLVRPVTLYCSCVLLPGKVLSALGKKEDALVAWKRGYEIAVHATVSFQVNEGRYDQAICIFNKVLIYYHDCLFITCNQRRSLTIHH